tara:strand:+ start:468 stop:986 length:519 start_codon:yes stop_codon:yes gene_type:complete
MFKIDKFYHEIKYILLEYNSIIDLDIQYMSEYLKQCGKDLNITNNDLVQEYNKNMFKNEEIPYNKTLSDNISKIFYKPLAKKLHPDKNNNNSEEFIKINKAYEKNDYLTLFIYYYETKIDIKITNDIISHIKQKLIEKKEEIENIKRKIHWKWALSNDIEKEFIHEYVKNKI